MRAQAAFTGIAVDNVVRAFSSGQYVAATVTLLVGQRLDERLRRNERLLAAFVCFFLLFAWWSHSVYAQGERRFAEGERRFAEGKRRFADDQQWKADLMSLFERGRGVWTHGAGAFIQSGSPASGNATSSHSAFCEVQQGGGASAAAQVGCSATQSGV